jgi:hypothetical protein
VFRDIRARGEWVPTVILFAIGVTLAVLAPPKQGTARAKAANL